ncbi:MAG: dynamin family protein [Chitinispirillaceae bacterium]
MSSKKKQKSGSVTEKPDLKETDRMTEPLSFDEIVTRALSFCDKLPQSCSPFKSQLSELKDRLSGGRLQLAVLGQFNRGKSTFINALLGVKILPTSVLPLTSVPTMIEYGNEYRCTVRFLDSTEDHIVQGSAKDVEAALRLYVAEENNPENRYHVRDVSITCNSPLLMNGTVLIDTPGFGSTYQHNTKTTMDLLVECDAALFILSTDPPMTQTEIDFLGQVKAYVSKIFFVLNKIDLLSDQEATQIDTFIRRLMHQKLGFPSDTALYHTCAVKGESAQSHTPEDREWVRSGIEKVKKDVLDFMVREKYFTLSEALTDKFKEALSGIKGELESDLESKRDPILRSEKNLNRITERIQDLTLEMERELREASECQNETGSQIQESLTGFREEFDSYVNARLDKILQDAYFPAEAASIASTLLPQLIDDYASKLSLNLLEKNNRVLRRLVLKHCREFTSQIEQAAEIIASELKPPSAEELISEVEVPLLQQESFSADNSFPLPPPKISDIFKSKANRLSAIREFYLPLCEKEMNKQLEATEALSTSRLEASWERLRTRISDSHMSVIDSLKKLHENEKSALGNKRGQLTPQIKRIEGLLRESEEIERLTVFR